VENLQKTIESTMARAQEKRAAEEKAHADEVERIQKTNGQLRTTLETMLSAPKK
jgi:septal ring factor EnvC (AmiA/AmiB activator)